MEIREIRMIMTDRVQLVGRIYLPDGAGPHPAVVMSHGFSALMDMGLTPYAKAFQSAGLATTGTLATAAVKSVRKSIPGNRFAMCGRLSLTPAFRNR